MTSFLPSLETTRWVLLFELTVIGLVLLSVPSVLLQRRGKPRAALTWLLAMVALPAVTLVLWWLIGRRYMHRRRRKRTIAMEAFSGRLAHLRERMDPLPEQVPSALLPLGKLLTDEQTGVFSPTSGNRVRVYPTTAACFADMERAIREAEHHIHLLFYIWNPDYWGTRFRDLLAERAREGLEVRVLFDAIGSKEIGTRFMRPLVDAGGQAKAFLPLAFGYGRSPTLNFRNHRKIVVVDGQVAFTGSFNVGDEYVDERKDLGLAIEGPAVYQLQEVFADDWYFTANEDLAAETYFIPPNSRQSRPFLHSGDPESTCAVISSGPDYRYNATYDAFFLAFTSAKQRIFITTPYFIPDQGLMMALRAAVLRGVDVRLLLPRKSDIPLIREAARSYFPELLTSGVRIYEHIGRFLHSKSLIFDEELSVLGSANLDNRSFLLNFEASCFLHSREVNRQLTEIFEDDLRYSVEVTEESLDRQTKVGQLGDALANLLAPLL